ncbi:hypothetical protein ACFWBS_44245 [Streptomyces mirabilis]|uniref:5-methylcytosine restriction system specificity protein McrC n=1 Tax=Streptomyces mirabilis TaxID=68239 RepID=UPI003662E76F
MNNSQGQKMSRVVDAGAPEEPQTVLAEAMPGCRTRLDERRRRLVAGARASVVRHGALHGADAQAELIRVKPDFVWYDDSDRLLVVVDAKYKAERPEGFPDVGFYQLLAYGTALHLAAGHLIYAKGNAPHAAHRIRNAGITSTNTPSTSTRPQPPSLPPRWHRGAARRLRTCRRLPIDPQTARGPASRLRTPPRSKSDRPA